MQASSKKHRKVMLLWLVGDGVLRDDITALGIEDYRQSNFFGAVPKHKAQEIMLRSGCLLLPLKDRPAFRITVPSRFLTTWRPDVQLSLISVAKVLT